MSAMNRLLEHIEKMEGIVYHIDKPEFEKEFQNLLNEIEGAFSELANKGIKVNINNVLIKLQNAYIGKDYVELVDVLEWELKFLFQEAWKIG